MDFNTEIIILTLKHKVLELFSTVSQKVLKLFTADKIVRVFHILWSVPSNLLIMCF